jgi:glycosyltransferase involved in cell wall biosynthesis
MKTIAIDARLWGTKNTGPGRYTENLLAFLPTDSRLKIVLIISADQLHEPKLAAYEKVVAKFHPYSPVSQIEMLMLLIKIHPDIFHATHFTVPVFWPGKVVVTIHDLIKHYSTGRDTTTQNPLWYWFKYLGYRFVAWWAINRSVHIIVPSNYWKNQLHTSYSVPLSKITVTYEGAFSTSTSNGNSLDLPNKPYVLYVGNMYPHKNIPTLLEAIARLSGQVLLILVCARSVFSDRITKLIADRNMGKWVKYLGYVPDSDLPQLYSHSLAYVFPSKIEGFGLPGLEAMAAKTALISSNSSCLPEIYGHAALYFDPDDPGQLASLILQLKSDPALRTKLILAGSTQIKKYSWSKMAKETFGVYLQALDL